MNQRTESVNHEPQTSATAEHPAEIVLDGDQGDQLRVTAGRYTDDGSGFFRFDYYLEIGDYPDEEPVSSIEISPEAAMHLALALGGTANRFIEASK